MLPGWWLVVPPRPHSTSASLMSVMSSVGLGGAGAVRASSWTLSIGKVASAAADTIGAGGEHFGDLLAVLGEDFPVAVAALAAGAFACAAGGEDALVAFAVDVAVAAAPIGGDGSLGC